MIFQIQNISFYLVEFIYVFDIYVTTFESHIIYKKNQVATCANKPKKVSNKFRNKSCIFWSLITQMTSFLFVAQINDVILYTWIYLIFDLRKSWKIVETAIASRKKIFEVLREIENIQSIVSCIIINNILIYNKLKIEYVWVS